MKMIRLGVTPGSGRLLIVPSVALQNGEQRLFNYTILVHSLLHKLIFNILGGRDLTTVLVDLAHQFCSNTRNMWGMEVPESLAFPPLRYADMIDTP